MEYTFPKTMDEAIKWQSMLSVHMPVEMLRHQMCVCNKHFNRSNFDMPQENEHFNDQQSLSYASSSNVLTGRAEDEAPPLCSQCSIGSTYTMMTGTENPSVRKDSGYESIATGPFPSSTKASCCTNPVLLNLKRQTKHTIEMDSRSALDCRMHPKNAKCVQTKCQPHSDYSGCSINYQSKMQKHQKSPVFSTANQQYSRVSPLLCKPLVNADPALAPVNVLMVGGLKQTTHKYGKSSTVSETEINVLESKLGSERVLFKQDNVPKFTVCRAATGETSTGVDGVDGAEQNGSTTEVLLMGQTEFEIKSCPDTTQCFMENESEKLMKIKRNTITELEALLSQQKQIQESIQKKVDELQYMDKRDKNVEIRKTSTQPSQQLRQKTK